MALIGNKVPCCLRWAIETSPRSTVTLLHLLACVLRSDEKDIQRNRAQDHFRRLRSSKGEWPSTALEGRELLGEIYACHDLILIMLLRVL